MWAMLGRAIALAVALVAISPTATAKETVQQRIEALLTGSELLLPEGEGPFPVVIQMHGCGGKKKLQGRWAAVANEAGWAVLVVDSYAHRGISTFQAYTMVCTGARLWGRERAGDLYAMMEWVRGQSWADAGRIVAAGWSHGGWSVLDGMSLTPGRDIETATRLSGVSAEPLAGLVGAFVVYPYQGFGAVAPGQGLRIGVPVKALVGTNDQVVGGRGLARTLENTKTPGPPVEIAMMQGATHAFDELEARDIRVRYDPELTAQAHAMYADYLRTAAGRTSTILPAPVGPGG